MAIFPHRLEEGAYLDVEEVFGEDVRALVNGFAGTIELAAQHLRRDWHAQHVTCELHMSAQVVDVGSTFEDLPRVKIK